MKKYLPALVLVFVVLWCAPVFAQGSTRVFNLEVEGHAVINQSDVAGARDGAIQDALQRAISEAASSLLSLSVTDKTILSLKNKIIEQQDRYINNYKITAESKQAEMYTVSVNVAVALPDLQNDLAKMGLGQIPGEEKTDIIVYLEIKGFNNYSDYSYLKEFLKERAKIVKNIYSRSFEWQKANLKLEISGTAQALADELAKTGWCILDTGQIKNNKIAISLLQRKGEQ